MAGITEYFSMQGRVYIGRRNPDGTRQPAHWVYDASTLELAMSANEEEKTESWTGARGVAATLKTSRTVQINLTLAQLNTDNVALAVDGSRVEIADGTVSAETIGNVKAGDAFALEYAAVSDVELTAGTPAAPLVDGVDYTLTPETGMIRFLTDNEAVSAAYSYAAHSIVTALTGGSPDYYLMFDGLNTVDGTVMRCRGEVYRVSFPPAETLGFIQDSFGELALQGKAKLDEVRQIDPKWGAYARITLISPEAP